MTSPAEWYYAKGGTRYGPVTSAQLARLVSAGEVTSDCHVWRDGMTEWKRLADVPELHTTAEPPPVIRSESPPARSSIRRPSARTHARSRNHGVLYTFGTICKVLAVLWSLFCLAGLCYGAASAALKMNEISTTAGSDAERAGYQIGFALGVAFGVGWWAALWLAIAGPLTLLWAATRVD